MKYALAIIVAASAAFPLLARAAGNDNLGVYVQSGHNIVHGTDTDTLFLGVQVPWGERRPAWFGTTVNRYVDAYIGQWRGPLPSYVDKTYTQVAVLSTWRFRFNEGNSPWFSDAGVGLSYLDGIYDKPGRTFSTRLNFSLRAGVGRSFGERDQHEVSLNYQHYSNAGIKKPNPGEDFLQLRYAYKF